MKFSVVIPTFNRHAQTVAAVASALAPRGVGLDVEVVVVDDGSTDGSKASLAEAYRDDPRVRIIDNRRTKGPAGARNTGIDAATGEFVALLDSDDLFLDGHLGDCAAVLARHAEVDVVFGRALYEQDGRPVDYMGPNFDRKLALAPVAAVDAGATLFGDGFFDHLLQYGCYFNLSTVVLRAKAARESMNESLRIAEDYEFWVRLSRRHRFACVDRPQIRYTLHASNISFEANGSAEEHAPRLLQAYGIMRGYPDLTRSQRGWIEHHVADVLFCWAHRCQQRREWAESYRLHRCSFRHGMRAENALAIVKLAMRRLAPGAVPSSVGR